MVQKLLYPVEDARHQLSIGRTQLYKEVKAGRLIIVKVGGKSLVPQSSIDTYVETKIAEARAAA